MPGVTCRDGPGWVAAQCVRHGAAHDVRSTMCALPYVRSVWDQAGERAGTDRESGEGRRERASSGREKTTEGGVDDQFDRR